MTRRIRGASSTELSDPTADQAAAVKALTDAAVLEAAPDLVVNCRSLSRMETVYGNGARLTVAGAGKAVRGAHPEVIIGDDVLTEDGSATEYQRRKTSSWWFGTVGGIGRVLRQFDGDLDGLADRMDASAADAYPARGQVIQLPNAAD